MFVLTRPQSSLLYPLLGVARRGGKLGRKKIGDKRDDWGRVRCLYVAGNMHGMLTGSVRLQEVSVSGGSRYFQILSRIT